MPTRPSMLRRSATVTGLLALMGLFPGLVRAYQAAAFDAKQLPDVLASLGGSAPVESPLLHLIGPEVADNGASVSLGVNTTLAGVSQLLLLAENNPTALLAWFRPVQGGAPDFNLQAKLVESSDVYAVALMADGRAYFARKQILVVKGACGAGASEAPTEPSTDVPEPIRIRVQPMGDRVVVRVLISHVMESGQRRDETGRLVPAHFIQVISATHNGVTVFTAEWGPWVARNPVLRFEVRGARPDDKIGLSWRDNRGQSRSDEVMLK